MDALEAGAHGNLRGQVSKNGSEVESAGEMTGK